jgi:hypothetical protein
MGPESCPTVKRKMVVPKKNLTPGHQDCRNHFTERAIPIRSSTCSFKTLSVFYTSIQNFL